ncbi:MAG: ATP-binding protein [Candidatus Riflebacteria bacterium]|nr:ATP-binding protein [Candidatus Riflebacteria bacterium]
MKKLLHSLPIDPKDRRYRTLFQPPLQADDFINAFLSGDRAIVEPIMALWQETVDAQIAAIAPGGKPPVSPFLDRLETTASLFRLTPVERDSLALLLLQVLFKDFQSLVNAMPGGWSRRMWGNGNELVWFSPHSEMSIMQALGRSGPLHRLGLCQRDHELAGEVVQFLSGLGPGPLSRRYFDTWSGKVLPLACLPLAEGDLLTIRSLLANRRPDQAVNILFGGPPGTGKTETVRALAADAGHPLYEVGARRDDTDGCRVSLFRVRAIWACQAIAETTGAFMLVDEADDLLDAGRPGRLGTALVPELLERGQGVRFWVANRLEDLDPGTRRRFDFAVRFERATLTGRQAIWENCRQRYDLTAIIGPEDVLRLAEKPGIEAGEIDAALRHVAGLRRKGWTRARILAQVERLVEARDRFAGKGVGSFPKPGLSGATLAIDSLNIEPAEDLAAVLGIVDSWREGWVGLSRPGCMERARETSPEGKPFGERLPPPGLRILLEGPPGTGKTHFAASLAGRLGRPLHHKTVTSLVSRWVGETEASIREAFRTAEDEGAVLFLDEIDGLLASRESAGGAWEVTRVNEMLSALEAFPGVFVAATNREAVLVTAALRRFTFRLRFGPLGPAAMFAFYQALLLPFGEGPFGEREAKALRAMAGLVPGDFAGLHRCLALRPGGRLRHAELILKLGGRRDARRGGPRPAIGFRPAAAGALPARRGRDTDCRSP